MNSDKPQLVLNRIEVRDEIPNIGSWRVMEKINMKFEGILKQHLVAKGEFRDLKLYANMIDYKELFAYSSI